MELAESYAAARVGGCTQFIDTLFAYSSLYIYSLLYKLMKPTITSIVYQCIIVASHIGVVSQVPYCKGAYIFDKLFISHRFFFSN
jgi:hypothetical protein